MAVGLTANTADGHAARRSIDCLLPPAQVRAMTNEAFWRACKQDLHAHRG
jgi:hypothetical protein